MSAGEMSVSQMSVGQTTFSLIAFEKNRGTIVTIEDDNRMDRMR